MNLLVTGAWNSAKENLHKLKQLGHNVVFMQFEKDPLPCDYQWVEGVVCNGLFLHHSIEKFTNLKYIQLTSAGLDRVPMEYVKKHGIKIHNARGVYSIPMAEFAIAGVLQIYKQMQFFTDNQRKQRWEKHRGCLELFNKKVCIVGCGSVGNECAKRFKAFDCDVAGVDLVPREDNLYSRIYPFEEIDNVLPDVDVLVLCVPLTKETINLLNKERFNKIKQGAVLVNISRGAVVNEKALIENVSKLGGAVLDVFEQEPLEDNSPLWNAENIIITPHNSFVGDNNNQRLTKVILENLSK